MRSTAVQIKLFGAALVLATAMVACQYVPRYKVQGAGDLYLVTDTWTGKVCIHALDHERLACGMVAR